MGPFSLEMFTLRSGQPLPTSPASPCTQLPPHWEPGQLKLPLTSNRGPRLTCSCSISLYARSSSRALKRLWSLYMRVPSETGCTAKALRKAELPSFSGSLFLASSNERYCCP